MEAAFEVAPVELDFGEVPAGSEASLDFEIENAGSAERELYSVGLIEGQSSVFAVERTDDGAVAGNTSVSVSVRFTPEEEAEDYAGRVQVRSALGSAYVILAGAGGASVADNDGDGWSPADGDCDDRNPGSFPGAAETCDGRDNDCDGTVPADEADADHDGYMLCEGDCDDTVATAYPGADEVCDDADSDCDGVSADREDRDGDGQTVCDGDCDDAEPAAYAGGTESCDGIDNDCSGAPDDLDQDGDGFSTCQGDCDDEDASSHPVQVSPDGSTAGDGTPDAPFDRLADALDAVTVRCPTVSVGEGLYEEAVQWSAGEVELVAVGDVRWQAPTGSRALTITGGQVSLEGLTLVGGGTEGDGGAVSVDAGSLYATRTSFQDSSATGDGGAIAASSALLVFDTCSFTGNTAGDDGGAIAAQASVLWVADSSFTANTAVRGGAVELESSEGWLGESHLSANLSEEQGGAIEVIGGGALVLSALEVWSNEAGADGGGLSLVNVDSGELRFIHSSVVGNRAGGRGGGVSLSGSAAAGLLGNLTLAENTSAGGGAAIDVDVGDARGLYLWSNVLLFNYGPAGLGGPGGGVSVGYTTAYATSSGTDLGLTSLVDAGGNEVQDPQLTSFSANGDPTDDDLRPLSSSPCVDRGPSAGGPDAYDWTDTDGSSNDRGGTGGPRPSPLEPV